MSAISRNDLALWLLERFEALPGHMSRRIMATTEHLAPPNCKVPATCEACVRDEYLEHADDLLAAIARGALDYGERRRA